MTLFVPIVLKFLYEENTLVEQSALHSNVLVVFSSSKMSLLFVRKGLSPVFYLMRRYRYMDKNVQNNSTELHTNSSKSIGELTRIA